MIATYLEYQQHEDGIRVYYRYSENGEWYVRNFILGRVEYDFPLENLTHGDFIELDFDEGPRVSAVREVFPKQCNPDYAYASLADDELPF